MITLVVDRNSLAVVSLPYRTFWDLTRFPDPPSFTVMVIDLLLDEVGNKGYEMCLFYCTHVKYVTKMPQTLGALINALINILN